VNASSKIPGARLECAPCSLSKTALVGLPFVCIVALMLCLSCSGQSTRQGDSAIGFGIDAVADGIVGGNDSGRPSADIGVSTLQDTLPDSAACISAADCPDGLVCNSFHNPPRCGGLAGDMCTSDSDCVPLAFCSLGFFEEKACTLIGTKGIGRQCLEDLECEMPLVCHYAKIAEIGDSVCAAPSEYGESCVKQSDCRAGLTCSEPGGLGFCL
jgi:hypothetical protein